MVTEEELKMSTSIYRAPVCQMKAFKNLFIEMSAKNCNMRCKHCYIDFPMTKNVKDFISVNCIKENLALVHNSGLECIYLTGAEPMTHPDFNTILRLCLKVANVCIITNGSFINEKKARFLKNVEDENDYEIIITLSLAHFDELKNDEVRCRGAFRQTLSAVKALAKYGFSPIISVTNFYNEAPDLLRQKVMELCNKVEYDVEPSHVKINRYIDKNNEGEPEYDEWKSLDCEYGRILTVNGVYVCPFLANDHRGRCGSTLADFSQKMVLETDFCENCTKNPEMFFGIDFQSFGP